MCYIKQCNSSFQTLIEILGELRENETEMNMKSLRVGFHSGNNHRTSVSTHREAINVAHRYTTWMGFEQEDFAKQEWDLCFEEMNTSGFLNYEAMTVHVEGDTHQSMRVTAKCVKDQLTNLFLKNYLTFP